MPKPRNFEQNRSVESKKVQITKKSPLSSLKAHCCFSVEARNAKTRKCPGRLVRSDLEQRKKYVSKTRKSQHSEVKSSQKAHENTPCQNKHRIVPRKSCTSSLKADPESKKYTEMIDPWRKQPMVVACIATGGGCPLLVMQNRHFPILLVHAYVPSHSSSNSSLIELVGV